MSRARQTRGRQHLVLVMVICLASALRLASAVREIQTTHSHHEPGILVKRWNLVQNGWPLKPPLELVESVDSSDEDEQEEHEQEEEDHDKASPINMEAVQSAVTIQQQQQLQLRQQRRDAVFVAMLGGLCGMVDALFCHHFDCYANMMTGNTIKLANSLAHDEYRAAAKYFMMILFYMSGCSLWPVIQRNAEQQRQVHASSTSSSTTAPMSKPTRLRHIVPAMFGLFVLSDVAAKLVHPSLFLPILSVAFGLVNTATIDCIGVVTNAATGHVSKIGMGLVGYVLQGCGKGNVPLQHVGYLLSFAGAILVTTKLYGAWLLTGKGLRLWLPPLGLTLGCLYAAAVLWYTSPLTPSVAAGSSSVSARAAETRATKLD